MNPKKIKTYFSLFFFIPLLATHFIFTLLYTAPPQAIPAKAKSYSVYYSAALFHQYWGLFVPVPKRAISKMYIKFENNNRQYAQTIVVDSLPYCEQFIFNSLFHSLNHELEPLPDSESILIKGKQPGSFDHALKYALEGLLREKNLRQCMITTSYYTTQCKSFHSVNVLFTW